jgi:hypothetical protein
MNEPNRYEQEPDEESAQETTQNEAGGFAEQAAVQMPIEHQPEASDGVAASPSPPTASTPPFTFEEMARSWQEPLPPRTYIKPPFYPNAHAPMTEQAVRDHQQLLRSMGYEAEAIDLEFKFRTLVQAPGDEFERLRCELWPRFQQRRQMKEALQAQKEQATQEWEQKCNAFIEQMARARLPLPPTLKRRPADIEEPIPISPRLVEEALTHDFATHEEICGQHGVIPTREKAGWWAIFSQVGQWLMELLAPLAAGLILGVNIAVITGFLRLEDFRQGRQMWLVALAAFIGFFIEKLVGTVCYSVTSSLAQSSERPLDVPEASPFPRLRSAPILVVFGLFALLVATAVVTVDALGLRMLHEQAVQQAKLLGTQAGEVLPFWVYVIAGCVISLPYLIYKAMLGWRQSELQLRDARIAYLHWKHVEQRRSEPEVQAAFRLAQEVVGLRERYKWLQERLAEIEEEEERDKQRIDSARTQADGCQLEYVQYWESLQARLQAQRDGLPLGRHGRAIPFNRRVQNEPPDTFLRRLMRLFRSE